MSGKPLYPMQPSPYHYQLFQAKPKRVQRLCAFLILYACAAQVIQYKGHLRQRPS